MSKAWEGGSTAEWRTKRAYVLRRDNWRCQLRIEGICKTRADCVHHTVGRAVSGDNPEFMVAACTPCNQNIGDPARFDPEPEHRTRW